MPRLPFLRDSSLRDMLATGAFAILIIGVAVWALNLLTGILRNFWHAVLFKHITLPDFIGSDIEQFIFTICAVLLTLALAIVMGAVITLASKTQLKGLTPVIIPAYQGIADSVAFVVSESTVTIDGAEQEWLTVFTPSLPLIIIGGKVRIVKKKDSVKILNPLSDILKHMFSMGRKRIDWEFETWNNEEMPNWLRD